MHLNCYVIDRAFEHTYALSDDGETVQLRPAAALTPDTVATITEQGHIRVLQWLARSGLINRDDVREMVVGSTAAAHRRDPEEWPQRDLTADAGDPRRFDPPVSNVCYARSCCSGPVSG